MRSSKKSYDAEFKREAVRLAANSERGDSTIERELGLYQGAIRTWRKALCSDPVDAFPGTGHMKPTCLPLIEEIAISSHCNRLFNSRHIQLFYTDLPGVPCRMLDYMSLKKAA